MAVPEAVVRPAIARAYGTGHAVSWLASARDPRPVRPRRLGDGLAGSPRGRAQPCAATHWLGRGRGHHRASAVRWCESSATSTPCCSRTAVAPAARSGLGTGFLLEGRPVVLHAPVRGGPPRPARTASGSVTVTAARARVARAGRIVRGGQTRRRAGGEGVGRRPARRRGRRGAASAGSTTFPGRSRAPDRQPGAGSVCSWTTSSSGRRRAGSPTTSAAAHMPNTSWSSATLSSTSGRASDPTGSG
ncbi:MAG: DUF3097 family protein [Nocardioidaceae bacterium]